MEIKKVNTASHIRRFAVMPSFKSSVNEENSTPIVPIYKDENSLLINLCNKLVFPTPKSILKINL